ncbi:hypothetical protein GRX01_00540 [Halobaculum sp. WSA2]|uniref:DUF8113 domain-containing protein n=1 Tax=Halobaculum saliterrae TaxID=2073113 RepID=A0A6B0SV91_9EURY|nr:hypothetical protein [Halobaculum saliterrae]MXR39850.1 hypothetical protein [Halobaculum saliterrae]
MSEDSDDPTDRTDDGTDGSPAAATTNDDAAFERELARARALLDDADDDEITAVHVGVVRGDRVNSTAARRGEGERAGLETLTLLASHLRTVADEAGVDHDVVAADAARLAGEVETLPPDRPDADE